MYLTGSIIVIRPLTRHKKKVGSFPKRGQVTLSLLQGLWSQLLYSFDICTYFFRGKIPGELSWPFNNNNNNFINCRWVDTQWQWSFNMLNMYGLFALDLVVGRGATREACSTCSTFSSLMCRIRTSVGLNRSFICRFGVHREFAFTLQFFSRCMRPFVDRASVFDEETRCLIWYCSPV